MGAGDGTDQGPKRNAANDRFVELEHAPVLTDYDRRHLATYSALLHAEMNGLDWRLAAQTLLMLDVAADEAGAQAIWEAHLRRARWFWVRENADRT